MNATLLILAVAITNTPLPTKVEQAKDWPPVPAAGFRKPDSFPPVFEPVKVGTRNRNVIQEYRDPQQFYAIFRTGPPPGSTPQGNSVYRAFEIKNGRYVPLPTDSDDRGQPNIWPTLEDAAVRADNHWRGARGQEQIEYPPSPTLKRMLKEINSKRKARGLPPLDRL